MHKQKVWLASTGLVSITFIILLPLFYYLITKNLFFRRSNAHKHHIVSLLQLFIDENCRPDEVFSVRPYIDGRSLESLMLGPGYGGDVKLIDGERCFDLETAAKVRRRLLKLISTTSGRLNLISFFFRWTEHLPSPPSQIDFIFLSFFFAMNK